MMQLRIRQATQDDRVAWDAYVAGHPAGLPYQFWGWGQAVEEAYAYRSHYLLAESGADICGVLPLIAFRIPLRGTRLISLPYCDAGGVVADSAEIATALVEYATEMPQGETPPGKTPSGKTPAAKKGARKGQLRCTIPLLPHQSSVTSKVRMILQLPADSPALLASMKAKVRSQVKKPQRDGLTAKLGQLELIPEFYTVFAENMRDLGSPVHSRRWIEAVVSAYGEHCRVAVVYTPQGEVAAAGIILLHPNLVVIPWASTRQRFNKMNPNMLLYWTFLAFACDHGYPQFDFGRSTPEEGTYRFKKQWGASPHPLYWYELPAQGEQGKDTQAEASPFRHGATKQAANLATTVWQKLPLPVANALGPELRKYISL